jgi:hypothetical protein
MLVPNMTVNSDSPQPSRVGVFTIALSAEAMRTAMDAPVKAGHATAETARVIEELGYRSLWLGGVTADLSLEGATLLLHDDDLAEPGGELAGCARVRSGCWLVVRIRRSGHLSSSVFASTAQASRTCSQLSNTNSSRRSASRSQSAASDEPVACSWSPRAATTDCPTRPSSFTFASSTSHTPSVNARRTSAAARTANRVLPTPPTPVSVTSRAR